MEEIFSKLDEISERIRNVEEERKKLAEFLRELKEFEIEKDSKAVEGKLAIKVKPVELDNVRFIGVDGGLAKRSYHSLDLILTRAVGAIFDYRKNRLDAVSYFPSISPTPKLRIVQDASESDFQYIASFDRMKIEVETMIKCLEKSPTILLADGSIKPHPADQPRKGTLVYEEYKKVLDTYKKLYKKSSGVLLAGVVEDSRSSTFSDYISDKILGQVRNRKVDELKKILHHTRDTNLLFHVLNKGERSFVMRMKINTDLGDYGRNMYLFYLKTTEFDRPVRVEFYESGDPLKTANRIASLVFSVSSENQEYGLPPVILEADGRAKIREGELDIIHSHIVDRAGNLPSLYRLRRDRRPF